jgi:hypothetical protein
VHSRVSIFIDLTCIVFEELVSIYTRDIYHGMESTATEFMPENTSTNLVFITVYKKRMYLK